MIPKLLHFIWIEEGGIQMPEQYAPNIPLWEGLNPGWSAKLWSGPELEGFISSEFPSFLPTWLTVEKAVMRSDLARVLLVYRFGGIYLDVDLKPLTGQEAPLDRFLSSGRVYNKYLSASKVPDIPSQDFVDLENAQSLVVRENCKIDNRGHGVANGVLVARPEAQWLMDFAEQQKDCYKGKVLDFMGPWALTRFWRKMAAERREEAVKGAVMLPPHYFLWESYKMKCQPPFYAISEHAGKNTWGDHEISRWWTV